MPLIQTDILPYFHLREIFEYQHFTVNAFTQSLVASCNWLFTICLPCLLTIGILLFIAIRLPVTSGVKRRNENEGFIPRVTRHAVWRTG